MEALVVMMLVGVSVAGSLRERRWQVIAENSGGEWRKAHKRLHYLQSMGLTCRLNKKKEPGLNMPQLHPLSPAICERFILSVRREEQHQAKQLLDDFNE